MLLNKYFDKKKVKKILLIKNDMIGDIILSSNVFRELREEFPKAKITLVCSELNKSLVEKNPYFEEIIVLNSAPRTFKDFLSYLKASIKIRKEKYDLGVELRGSFSNIFFLMFLPGIKYRIGFYSQYYGKFLLHYGKTKKDYENKKRHCVLQRLDLINNGLGLNRKNYWPEIWTDKGDEKYTNKLMKKNGLKKKQFICIVPDSSMEKKAMPIEKFDLLIKHFEKNYPEKKILILGTDKKKIDWLKKKHPQIIVLIKENLRVLYLLFKKSSLIIAHDGGPMHIAWVGRSPTLALIEKYLPLEYIEPLGKNGHYIYAELKKIKVSEITEKIDEILAKKS